MKPRRHCPLVLATASGTRQLSPREKATPTRPRHASARPSDSRPHAGRSDMNLKAAGMSPASGSAALPSSKASCGSFPRTKKGIGIVVIMLLVTLGTGLGVGLGVGLAARHLGGPATVPAAQTGQSPPFDGQTITSDTFFYGQSPAVYPSRASGSLPPPKSSLSLCGGEIGSPEKHVAVATGEGPWADAFSKARAFVAQLTLDEKVGFVRGWLASGHLLALALFRLPTISRVPHRSALLLVPAPTARARAPFRPSPGLDFPASACRMPGTGSETPTL